MPSPFPGMDPFLEAQGFWPDFHLSFIAQCRQALNRTLPASYVALIDERVRQVAVSGEALREYRPDVAIIGEGGAPRGGFGNGAAVSTIEPVVLPIADEVVQEVRESRIEILRLPDRELVTVIEVLSPANKAGDGWAEYKSKRAVLIHRDIRLVEVDLLVAGRRPPLGAALPPGDYFAIVSRGRRAGRAEVYAWSVRRPLPTIPVPLKEPDPDAPLDLAAAFEAVYDAAPYARLVDYAAPLGLPLSDDDRAWAERVAAEARRA